MSSREIPRLKLDKKEEGNATVGFIIIGVSLAAAVGAYYWYKDYKRRTETKDAVKDAVKELNKGL